MTDADDPLDQDAVIAAADLMGRAGARGFEIGYLHEPDEPEYATRGPCWYAQATYKGHRIMVEDYDRPDEAAEGLALVVLVGARCRCGKLVALSDVGAMFAGDGPVQMADGSTWTPEEAAAAGQCRWQRIGPKWEPSCPEPKRPNRAQRRR